MNPELKRRPLFWLAVFWFFAAPILVTMFPAHSMARGRVSQLKLQAQFRNLQTSINMFQLDIGSVPKSLDELFSAKGVKGWKGPYLLGPLTPDPWGNPIGYIPTITVTTGSSFELTSLGADGKPGGRGWNQDYSSLKPVVRPTMWETGRLRVILYALVGLGWIASLITIIFAFFQWFKKKARKVTSGTEELPPPPPVA